MRSFTTPPSRRLHLLLFCSGVGVRRAPDPGSLPRRLAGAGGLGRGQTSYGRATDSGQMENLLQILGNRAAVRIGRHDVPHVLPPPPTRVGGRDRVPPLDAFDFDVAEQETALAIQVDRVVMRPVRRENGLKVRSDLVVPLPVFIVRGRIDRHQKSLADHRAFSPG